MNKPLDAEVRDLLENRRGDWGRLAAAAGVSHSWISQFMRGLIPNPGFMTLTKLQAALTATEKAA
jgi:transcriptional regulator with XRE-family HTH domain